MHFDSHGFGTYLHLLSGELLLLFSSGNETTEDREILLKNIRATGEMSDEEEAVFKKHMRYVVLQAGQMWYMEPGTLHALYRDEGTIIFSGHFIPKRQLGLWIEKMKEHLRWYDSTNEDPENVLLYPSKVLELISNADKRGVLYNGDWGDREEIVHFFLGARELLENGMSWIKQKDGWQSIKGKEWGDAWRTQSDRILKQHETLLRPGKVSE